MSTYDYMLVIDFEATCIIMSKKDFYPHEIIEFPCHILNVQCGSIIGHFHSYVKPVLNPVLSTFCKELTGITQESIDQAETFQDVEKKFLKFIQEHVPPEKTAIVVTDGNWDITKFLALQFLLHKNLHPSSDNHDVFPQWASEWIDIKKVFQLYHKSKFMKLEDMLKVYGLSFQGRPHNGYDDAYNIAQLAIAMMKKGYLLQSNSKITPSCLQYLERELLSYIKSREKQRRRVKSAELSKSRKVKNSEVSYESKTNTEKTDVYFDMGMDIDPDLHGSEEILCRHKIR